MQTKTTLKYTWCVAYINKDHLHRVDSDINRFLTLLKKEFPDTQKWGKIHIEPYIPTIQYLKKTFKGKDIFEQIPLLFNYGFFKIPRILARSPEFLGLMRKYILCISGWAKDPAAIYIKKPKGKIKKKEKLIEEGLKKKLSPVPLCAMVTNKEIEDLIKSAERNSVFTDFNIDQLIPGDVITLKGYPFENIPATIVAVHRKLQKVTVKLMLEMMLIEVKVSFENIFYTVYSDYDDERGLKEKSLDDIKFLGNKQVDKIYAKVHYNFAEDE